MTFRSREGSLIERGVTPLPNAVRVKQYAYERDRLPPRLADLGWMWGILMRESWKPVDRDPKPVEYAKSVGEPPQPLVFHSWCPSHPMGCSCP
jgi:hypothetical protein